VRLLRDFRSYFAGRLTLRTHVWQSLANYAQQGFGLILGMILARILTPADFGSYALVLASISLAHLPVSWSLNPALVADAGRTPSLFGHAASFAWAIVILRSLVALGLAGWFFATARHELAILAVLVGISESFREINSVQRASLEGRGIFKPNLISALAGILFCCVVVIPVALHTRSLYCLALPGLGGFAADWVIYRRFSGRSVAARPRWALPPELQQSSFWLWIATASDVALARFDKWFVGRFLGNESLGYYNRGFGYAPLAHMFLNSLTTNPTVSGLARCETPEARSSLFWKTARFVLLGGTINWAVFYFFSAPLVLLLFGPQWTGAVPAFEAFASLSLAYAISYLPAAIHLATRDYSRLGVVRFAMLLVVVAVLFLFRHSINPVQVAWLIQGALVVQGCVLFLLGRPFLTRRVP
jgi:O-antigen/teichoic acid export membrane protein